MHSELCRALTAGLTIAAAKQLNFDPVSQEGTFLAPHWSHHRWEIRKGWKVLRCSDRQPLLQTDLWDLMQCWRGGVIAKASMDNKVVVLGAVIFLCEHWGTRVNAWVHLAVEPCRAKKDCTTHHQKSLLKVDTSSDGEIVFKGYLPNTPQFKANIGLHYFSEWASP